jgi:hypothetical protein
MSDSQHILRGYMVSVRADGEVPDLYTVSYVPRGPAQVREPGQRPKKVPEFCGSVEAGQAQPVRWRTPPAEGAELAKFDADARARVNALHDWLGTLNALIESVRRWAGALEWSTKVIDKPMDDPDIGNYRAPALLLQKEAAKVLLEPVARSSPGSGGVVDLYIMPAYDDIATLYYYDGRWNLHYMTPDVSGVASMREAAAKPLSEASLKEVLEDMKSHAE